MESDNDQPSEQLAQAESLPKVIYRAVVWVAGTYKPSQSRIPDGASPFFQALPLAPSEPELYLAAAGLNRV